MSQISTDDLLPAGNVVAPPPAPPRAPRELNPVLDEILAHGAVLDGSEWVALHSHVSLEEGYFLQQLITTTQATRTLEVGMAYGVSTLFICDALSRMWRTTPRHIVIDPFQHRDWHDVGLRNLARAGFDAVVEFHQRPSEFVLPELLQEGRRIDFAFIDGWHSFDQALVEFYYVNRMLRVGGIVAFDDADWPSIRKLLRYLVSLPAYAVVPAPPRSGLGGRVRRAVADTALGRRFLHPAWRRRPWDLGIQNRYVALKKVAEDRRVMTWCSEDF